MSIESLKDKARRHEQKEDWQKALDLYLEAIRALENQGEEQDVSLYNRVGDLEVRLNRVKRAVRHYETAVDLYVEAELPNNAIALCKKVVRNVPERDAIYLKMGQIRAQQGFLTDARQNFLAYAERKQAAGDLEEAFRALVEFVELAPEDIEIRLALAAQLAQHDRIEEGVEQFQEARRRLILAGREGEARDVEEQILELEPEAELPDPESIHRDAEAEEPATPTSDDGWGAGFSDFGLGGGEDETEVETSPGEMTPLEMRKSRISGEDGVDEDPDADDDFAVGGLEGLDITSDEGEIDDGEIDEGAIEGEETEADGETAWIEPGAEHPGAADVERGEEDREEELEPLPMMEFGDEEERELEPLPTLGSDGEEGDDEALSGLEVEGAEEAEVEEAPLEEAPLEGEESREGAVEEAAFEEGIQLEEAATGAPAEEGGTAEAGGAAEDPEDVRSRGEALLEEGDEDQAWPLLERAHHALAERGDVEDALEVVDRMVEARPDRVPLHQRRVEYAYRTFDDEILKSAYLGLADALRQRGDTERARGVYRQVLETDPEDEDAQRALAELSGDTAEAVTGTARPRPEVASSEEYVDLGAMILEDEEEKTTRFVVPAGAPSGDEAADFQKMLSQFKEKVAENLETDDVSSHYDLGTAYKEMGLVDEAISEFQAALRAARGHLPTYEMLGQCFLEKGQSETAIRTLERALEAPHEIEDELLGIYYYLGRAHENLGRKEDALEFYDKVFALDINFMDVTERLRALR